MSLVVAMLAIAQLPASNPWKTREVVAPNVEYVTFTSKAAKTEVSFHLYKPAAYEAEKERRFPVLIWLHGSGGGLAGIRPLSALFDEAIRDKKIPPMLIVFPNGMASSMWCDSADGSVPMETVVVQELLPHVDRTFRTLPGRQHRILEGFSMGGFGAARLGLKHPDRFGTVSVLAGGPMDLDFEGPRTRANPAERASILKNVFGGDLEKFRAQHPLTIAKAYAADKKPAIKMRVAVGSRDFTAALNRSYSDFLRERKIEHTWTIVPQVGHDTLALLKGLGDANWTFYREALKD